MRAEVGLLTRNIKIQGVMGRGCPPNNENCEEFDHDTYGAHVKIFGFTSAHIEGVELTKVGQAFDNGFYPVHFHMCKDISGKEAVIKSNSFHNTYARATTIHGTWGTNETHPGVQILGNVAYDITGHCYFTEDGAEKYTVIDGNLGAYIKNIQTNGFETDRTGPTIFWITNPLVKLTNNAGSKGFGIWYVFPEEPVGPSQGLGAFQRGEAKRTPLWLFDNNVMHSMEQDGMRFDDILVDHMGRVTEDLDYMPLSDPFDEKSEPVKAQLSRLTCYKNFHRNTWLQAGWFELMQYSSAESRRGLQNAKDFKHDHHTFVKKSIFVGRSRENYEDQEYPDAPDILHYYGVIHYEDLFYMDQTWFNGFETTDKYAGGAFGFFPELKFGSFSSNTTDIRFGFVDKADGSGGNRILDGLAHVGQFVNKPADPTATFRNGDSSLLTCPGEEPKRHQVLMPHSYTATDECEIRNNWGMIACENNYGMIYVGAEGRGVRMNRPVTQAKRMNRLNGSDVAYEDHTGRNTSFVSNAFTTALGSDKYYYQFQFTEDFPRKTTFYGIGMDKDDPVVIGICLPVGLQLTQVHLLGVRPPDIVTPFDGWIIVNSLEELFEDDTMTSLYVEGRTAYIRLTSSLERDPHWDKLDYTHCPNNKCPYFQVEITAGDFDYTPCFTVPPDEQSKTMTDATMKSMTCDLPASAPDVDWGAGDASREVIQGGWGDWSSWTECCGDEVTTRRRICDNPPPKGGPDCPGDTSETMTCPVGCPVNGEWSQWSRWSGCFCDGVADRSAGAAVRTRTCNVDHEGQFCWGSLSEHKPCFGGC